MQSQFIVERDYHEQCNLLLKYSHAMIERKNQFYDMNFAKNSSQRELKRIKNFVD